MNVLMVQPSRSRADLGDIARRKRARALFVLLGMCVIMLPDRNPSCVSTLSIAPKDLISPTRVHWDIKLSHPVVYVLANHNRVGYVKEGRMEMIPKGDCAILARLDIIARKERLTRRHVIEGTIVRLRVCSKRPVPKDGNAFPFVLTASY